MGLTGGGRAVVWCGAFSTEVHSWWNWQTRKIQVLMPSPAWRFESSRVHHFSLAWGPSKTRKGRRDSVIEGLSDLVIEWLGNPESEGFSDFGN